MTALSKISGVLSSLRAVLSGRPLQVSRIPECPPGMERIRELVVVVGLRKLLTKPHYDSSGFKELVASQNIIPDGEVMRIIHPLHCVDWADMPVELRTEVQRIMVATFAEAEPPPEPVPFPGPVLGPGA